MPSTTNFGWTTPADTDLVKDGAAAIRTLGNGVDASFVDLKGGTTNQVLAKNSNTDLDFVWVTQDDTNAIQNTIVDAKGDLISATAADTPARLAVGTDGQVLTADSTTATGLKWAAAATCKILQVVTATTTTGAATTSSTYSDTNLTASITPTSSTSTILVLVAQTFDNVSGTGAVKLLRGATNIFESWGNAIRGSGIWNYSIVDSPATTSSTTYKTQFKSNASASFSVQSDGSKSTITLIEIGA